MRLTAAVGVLAVPMIEASGGAALLTLPGEALLLRTCLGATSGAAINLSAITRATQKETRAAT